MILKYVFFTWKFNAIVTLCKCLCIISLSLIDNVFLIIEIKTTIGSLKNVCFISFRILSII